MDTKLPGGSGAVRNDAGPSASTLPPTVPTRGRPPALGIMAGAAEEKYRVKVRELRAKIKAVEQDNDKMFTKTLEAKRNIQRLRIERAIIYERLNAGPPPQPPSPPPPPSSKYPPQNDGDAHDYYRKHELPPPPPRRDVDPRAGQYTHVAHSRQSRHHPSAISPLDTLPPSAPQYPPHISPGYSPPPPPHQSRMHSHQRMGPGAVITHDDVRDRERARDWEAEQYQQRRARPDPRYDTRYEYAHHHALPPPPPEHQHRREHAPPELRRPHSPQPLDDGRHYRDERDYAPIPHPHHAHPHAELARVRSGSSSAHTQVHAPPPPPPPHAYERGREERDVEMDERAA